MIGFGGYSWSTYLGFEIPKYLNYRNMYVIEWNVQKDGSVNVSIDDPYYGETPKRTFMKAWYKNIEDFKTDWHIESRRNRNAYDDISPLTWDGSVKSALQKFEDTLISPKGTLIENATRMFFFLKENDNPAVYIF